MKIDFETHRVIAQEETIWLTKIQNKLLETIYNNKDKVVTYKEIIYKIYQLECDESLKNLIRRHMTLLRKKVGQYIKIRTIRDVGYIIEEEKE